MVELRLIRPPLLLPGLIQLLGLLLGLGHVDCSSLFTSSLRRGREEEGREGRRVGGEGERGGEGVLVNMQIAYIIYKTEHQKYIQAFGTAASTCPCMYVVAHVHACFPFYVYHLITFSFSFLSLYASNGQCTHTSRLTWHVETSSLFNWPLAFPPSSPLPLFSPSPFPPPSPPPPPP